MDLHPASAWELIADALGSSPAIVHGATTRSWAEFDDRAARVAAGLVAAGLGPGSPVAIELYNSVEFLESHFGVLKARCVPVHVNYRYLDDELSYLLDNSEAEALIYHSSLGERAARVGRQAPSVGLLVEVDEGASDGRGEGAVGYEDLLAAHDPMARIERFPTDLVMSYTGGTTGLPKGVRVPIGPAERVLLGLSRMVLGLSDDVPSDDLLAAVAQLHAAGAAPVVVPASPLMHSTAMAMAAVPALSVGGTVVLVRGRSFDAGAFIDTVEATKATNTVIVGDAIARPLVNELDRRRDLGLRTDLATLRIMASAGVSWSAETKRSLLEHANGLLLVDSLGSTEGAWFGVRMTRWGEEANTRFVCRPGVIALDDTGRPLVPDAVTPGLLACPVDSPRTYYKDPERAAQIWRTIGGQAYVVPGDFGIIHPDGTIDLIGRGSSAINTGGEKVFPEEVENSLKELAVIDDCLVVGLPDPRWTQRVVAVVQVREGATLTSDEAIAHTHARLAAYKSPKDLVIVERVPRFTNGKPDYDGARRLAAAAFGDDPPTSDT